MDNIKQNKWKKLSTKLFKILPTPKTLYHSLLILIGLTIQFTFITTTIALLSYHSISYLNTLARVKIHLKEDIFNIKESNETLITAGFADTFYLNMYFFFIDLSVILYLIIPTLLSFFIGQYIASQFIKALSYKKSIKKPRIIKAEYGF